MSSIIAGFRRLTHSHDSAAAASPPTARVKHTDDKVGSKTYAFTPRETALKQAETAEDIASILNGWTDLETELAAVELLYKNCVAKGAVFGPHVNKKIIWVKHFTDDEIVAIAKITKHFGCPPKSNSRRRSRLYDR